MRDQLYRTYAESHEDDLPGIREGFKELDVLLKYLSLDDNKMVRRYLLLLCHTCFPEGVGMRCSGTMIREEFDVWKDEATAKRQEVESGILNMEEYTIWLKK